MEKVVIIKTDDVIFSTRNNGADGALFRSPFISREGVNVCGRGSFRAMAVFGHVRVGRAQKMCDGMAVMVWQLVVCFGEEIVLE